MYFAAQLRRAMKDDGVSAAQLARDFGVKPPSVNGWTKTGRFSKYKLPDLAVYFKRDIEWFIDRNYKPPKSTPILALHSEEQPPAGSVRIKESKVTFSGGSGRVNFDEIGESEPKTYSLSWLRAEGINPRRARRFQVSGDSMEPTLFAGDVVLVDTSQTEIVEGKTYAIRYGSELKLKRVSRQVGGTITLMSNNPRYRDEVIPADVAADQFAVIGRVCDKSGKGGL